MIINPDDEVLYDAVWRKAKLGEPWSTHDFRRFMDIFGKMNFAIEAQTKATPDEIAALQSQFIQLLQQKFMKG
jgi:hypothetical protein